VPFDWNVSYRIVAKDNHVPCIPTPQDATNEVPMNAGGFPKMAPSGINTWQPPPGCGAQKPGNSFSATYRTCEEMQKM
jgi:hypothetical protein